MKRKALLKQANVPGPSAITLETVMNHTNDPIDDVVIAITIAILPVCGSAMLWAGVTGYVSTASAFIFTSIAGLGTCGAIHETGKRRKTRKNASVLEERRHEQEVNDNRPPSWRERIELANGKPLRKAA